MEVGVSCSDEELCQLAAGGNQQAEELLVSRYFPLVRAISREYYLRGGDSDDVCQVGDLGLLHAIRSYSDEKGTSFKTFATLCIRNQICSAVRDSLRYKYDSLSVTIPESELSRLDGAIGEVYLASSPCDPEDYLLDKEMHEEFRRAADSCLSKFEKKVLGFYLCGHSSRSIAAACGKKQKSVDNAIQRIRRKLTQALNHGVFS